MPAGRKREDGPRGEPAVDLAWDLIPVAANGAHHELMLGIVRAPGTRLDLLETVLAEVWANFGFRYVSVRVAHEAADERSAYVEIEEELPDYKNVRGWVKEFQDFPKWDERCRQILRGDHARRVTGLDDIVLRDALTGVERLRELERASEEKESRQSRHVTWGFRAVRHPAEVNLLRDIYGGRYFTIGAYEPKGRREQNVVDGLKGEYPEAGDELLFKAARFLIDLEDHVGSRVPVRISSTFEKSDFFIDISRLDLMRRAVRRFVQYVLGYPFGTPTLDEVGMTVAFTSRKSSSALARAVGAAALSPTTGAILATGHNDIPRTPRAGPWPDDDLTNEQGAEPDQDYREHRYQFDVSDTRRFEAFEDLIDRLQKARVIAERKAGAASEVDGAAEGDGASETNALDERKRLAAEIFAKEGVRGATQFSAIEYSRTIHAEASLIAGAASRGTSLNGATLYVSTFPCHECTRLIIQAGITRVVFVEPYPKSLAAELYPQQIHYEDADSQDVEPHPLRVEYEPFVGIAPGRFNDIFSFEARKASDVVGSDANLAGEIARYPPEGGYRPRASILSTFLTHPKAIEAMASLEQLAVEEGVARWDRFSASRRDQASKRQGRSASSRKQTHQ